MISQYLNSPALNGLLSGVTQQTGVVFPDALRNMLWHFTEDPAMANTVNQLAQQVDREDFRHMFAGMGTGQEGSLDFSRMIRQMMPVVSQVLGGGSIQSEPAQNVVPVLQPRIDDRRLSGGGSLLDQSSQNDLQEVVQSMAVQSSPKDIFCDVVQSAAECSGTAEGELVDGLCGNDDLADQFMEILRRDLRRPVSGGNP